MVVFEICREFGIPTTEVAPRPKDLRGADAIFLSLSSWGIVEVVMLDGDTLRQSGWTEKIRRRYEQILNDETI